MLAFDNNGIVFAIYILYKVTIKSIQLDKIYKKYIYKFFLRYNYKASSSIETKMSLLVIFTYYETTIEYFRIKFSFFLLLLNIFTKTFIFIFCILHLNTNSSIISITELKY